MKTIYSISHASTILNLSQVVVPLMEPEPKLHWNMVLNPIVMVECGNRSHICWNVAIRFKLIVS